MFAAAAAAGRSLRGRRIIQTLGKLRGNHDVSSHEEYFESVSSDVQLLLASIQAKVEKLLLMLRAASVTTCPRSGKSASSSISRRSKKHIGIYPPVTQDSALVKELSRTEARKAICPSRSIDHYLLISSVAWLSHCIESMSTNEAPLPSALPNMAFERTRQKRRAPQFNVMFLLKYWRKDAR